MQVKLLNAIPAKGGFSAADHDYCWWNNGKLYQKGTGAVVDDLRIFKDVEIVVTVASKSDEDRLPCYYL